jgi:hypothetical protein
MASVCRFYLLAPSPIVETKISGWTLDLLERTEGTSFMKETDNRKKEPRTRDGESALAGWSRLLGGMLSQTQEPQNPKCAGYRHRKRQATSKPQRADRCSSEKPTTGGFERQDDRDREPREEHAND